MDRIARQKNLLNNKLDRLISNRIIHFKKVIILCIAMNWYKILVRDHLAKCSNVTTINEVRYFFN